MFDIGIRIHDIERLYLRCIVRIKKYKEIIIEVNEEYCRRKRPRITFFFFVNHLEHVDYV